MKSQLIRQYELTCDSVFDTPVQISPIHYRQFKKAEKRILAKGIYPSDYAEGISEYLKEWVYQKGWSHVPINIFCGQWAFDVYTKEVAPIKFFETPREVMEEGKLLHSELLVARFYISQKGNMKLWEVVDKLRLVLHPKWIEAYENKEREKVKKAVLEVLSVENDGFIESYDDLL